MLETGFHIQKTKQIGAPRTSRCLGMIWLKTLNLANPSDSVFLELPNSIRNRYLPSFDDVESSFLKVLL